MPVPPAVVPAVKVTMGGSDSARPRHRRDSPAKPHGQRLRSGDLVVRYSATPGAQSPIPFGWRDQHEFWGA